MFKKILLGLALCALFAGTVSHAQGRVISGNLPWDNDAATIVLQQRLEGMFPDGTPIPDLDAALIAERFSFEGDRRGYSSPTMDGTRRASRHVARFRFGCGTRLQMSWTQSGGQVFDIRGILHEGCL